MPGVLRFAPVRAPVRAHTASIKGTRQVETSRNGGRGDTRAETPLGNGEKNEVEVARRDEGRASGQEADREGEIVEEKRWPVGYRPVEI